MNITLVTPAPPRSRKGNRVTALRWAKMIRELGHTVNIVQRYDGRPCDLLLALHAWKSADSVRHFRRQYPDRPLVVALTGTDLYHDLPRQAAARWSIEFADRLVLLQPHGMAMLPEPLRSKARVIFQSAGGPPRGLSPLKRVLEVCVIGHLRNVKDPLRAAQAARRLPHRSRIRVVQIGAALSEMMAERARREEQANARYRWLGELPRGRTLRRLWRSRLLVVSSRLEGGPNVASEAIAAGVPILCTRISGMIGMLGEDYPGYFDVGDTLQLAELLERSEADAEFYDTLASHCRLLAPLVDPRRERQKWRELLEELGDAAGGNAT